MNLVYSYIIARSIPALRNVDLHKYNLSVEVKGESFFAFITPIQSSHPKFERVLIYRTQSFKDISNLISIFEFYNPKGEIRVDTMY
jgi:hypothetical protein